MLPKFEPFTAMYVRATSTLPALARGPGGGGDVKIG